MDLITQGLLGGTIGQALGAKKLGQKAVFWGFIAGLLPDTDVVMQFSDPMKGFLYHRWITHSLFFSVLIGPLMGWALAVYDQKRNPYDRPLKTTVKTWISICFWALFTHPLLDIMTSYGTQFFAPFSDVRLRLDAISVVDFGYSLPLIMALILGRRFLKKGRAPSAVKTARLTLAGTTFYLFMALLIREASLSWGQLEQLRASVPATLISHPTLMQPFERKLILQRQDNQTCVAHWHLWKGPLTPWMCKEKVSSSLSHKILNSPKGKIFQWFTGGDFFVDFLGRDEAGTKTSRIRLHDIRYPPSHRPFEGLWGIEFRIDETGTPLEDPHYFRSSWRDRFKSLRQFLLSTD